MFIEVTTKEHEYGVLPGAATEGWKRTVVRASAICIIGEPEASELECGARSKIMLVNGIDEFYCEQSVDEVLRRIQLLDNNGSTSYSVTLEGSGYSTTTTNT